MEGGRQRERAGAHNQVEDVDKPGGRRVLVHGSGLGGGWEGGEGRNGRGAMRLGEEVKTSLSWSAGQGGGDLPSKEKKKEDKCHGL